MVVLDLVDGGQLRHVDHDAIAGLRATIYRVALPPWRDLATQITGPADHCCDIQIRCRKQNARWYSVHDLSKVLCGCGSQLGVEA